MRILINSKHNHIKELLDSDIQYQQHLGWLNTPRYNGSFETFRNFPHQLPVAVDNSAFMGFDEDMYIRMIHKIKDQNAEILWLTVPDTVGDSIHTRQLFDLWIDRLEPLNIPLAYVAQDGETYDKIPWAKINCLFIGGTTEWKLSYNVPPLVKDALRENKLVHMGRVNSKIRLKYAYDIGCHSIDGTGYSQFSEKYLKPALDEILKLKYQPLLF